jgi:putative transposase
VWKDLHANVTRNHRCQDMEELMTQVRLYLGNRNKRKGHAYPRAMAV